MIKIENFKTFGWESAVRGMRNPLNSWDKSDSHISINTRNGYKETFVIGPNDLTLMKKLVRAGSDHSKFMRMINVAVDITAPLYWWKEFDTYKVGTVANSCSTMHTIHKKEFHIDDFSTDRLVEDAKHTLNIVIDDLNILRDIYNNFDTAQKLAEGLNTKEDVWYQIIQLLPSSYNQKRTVQLNYAVLRNMYHSRKNHKLDEWKNFCKFITALPYAKELICDE